MELSEAIEILLTMKKQLDECTKRNAEIDDSGIDDYTAQAIETVLQALEELQKENEKLKDRNKILENCKYVNILEIEKSKAEEKERWRNKIKEKIEELDKLPLVIVGGRRYGKTLQYGIKLGKIKAYEELLKGELNNG